MRGVFVTGTDTGVGKSIVAAAICAALAARGTRVAAFKPAVTGLDEPPGSWPPDHELLASAANAGQSAEDVAPYRFGPAVSPHLAAELAGVAIEPSRLLESALAATASAEVLTVEGVGGFMVPLTPDYLIRDLAAELGLPVVVVARPGLGTISQTLLTVEAVRAAGLSVVGVVMTPWPAEPSVLEASNRRTVERLASAEVTGLEPARPGSLARIGSALPLDGWVGARGTPEQPSPRRRRASRSKRAPRAPSDSDVCLGVQRPK